MSNTGSTIEEKRVKLTFGSMKMENCKMPGKKQGKVWNFEAEDKLLL